MTHVIAFLLSAASFACLCVSMKRHRSMLAPRGFAPPAAPLRAVGFAGLGAALVLDMLLLGAVQGALSWFGHMMVGAGLAAFGLAALVMRQNRR